MTRYASKPKSGGRNNSYNRKPRADPQVGRTAKSVSILKQRVLALTGEVTTLRLAVAELRMHVTGEQPEVHEDDLEGNQEEE